MIKPINKPSKKRSLLHAAKITWMEYSQTTTMHGIKYATDIDGNFITKGMWILITIICFITANVLVNAFWIRYKSNPTRMNVETNHAPLPNVPFPAITLCSSVQISSQRAYNLIKRLVLPPNITEDEVYYLLKQTSGFNFNFDYDPIDLDILNDILLNNRYTAESLMNELKQPCNELLFRCRWDGKIVDCESIFRRSVTYNGYCCSFNLKYQNRKKYAPQVSNYHGIGGGLSLVLKPLVENNSYLTTFSDGVRLLIHESYTYPSDTVNEKSIPHSSETFIRLYAEQTYCSSTVNALAINDRECVFIDEAFLTYFDSYRQSNCDVECRIKETIRLCDCLPYIYPDRQQIQLCNVTKIECLVDNYNEIYESNSMTNYTSNCRCLANCNGIYYEASTNSVLMNNYNNITSIDPLYKNINNSYTVVHIFFGRSTYTILRRDLLTNLVALIANLGGVYNLFIGMSIITFLEIPYFCIIRLYKNYKIAKLDDNKVNIYKKRLEEYDKKRFNKDNKMFTNDIIILNTKNTIQYDIGHK